MTSYTLEVPVTEETFDRVLSDVEALSPRQIELRDVRILAWIDAVPSAFPWPHTVSPAVLFDHESVWIGVPKPGPYGLTLDAGVAFGSGLHPTTMLCLERIEAGAPYSRVLDVGTGTGILALCALKLGSDLAHGTDVDPPSLDVARANAAANGLTLHTSVELPDGQFDLVVANIIGATLIAIAPDVVRRLGPRGTMLLSGIRESELDEVAEAYTRCGLSRPMISQLEAWCALELVAPW